MIDPINGFVFFTNAKCGGTTLKHWFLSSASFHQFVKSPRAVFGHFRSKVFELDYWKARHSSFQYLKYQDDYSARRFFRYYRSLAGDLNNPLLPLRKFILARSPYDRAVSAYIDKFCGDDRNKDWVRNVVRSCGVESPTFIDFLNYLDQTPADQMDAHWRQQTHVIEGVSDITILKLENLELELETHSQAWGDRNNAIVSQRRQSNTYDLDLNETDATNLTANNIVRLKQKHGTFPAKRAFLTVQAKDLVQSAYRSDFDRLGYDFSIGHSD